MVKSAESNKTLYQETPHVTQKHPAFNASFHQTLALFIYALFTYGWFSANIVMPILPQLTTVFHTTPASMKLSVTAFLFGFSVFQLVWGPISDHSGRKKVLFAGFTLTIIGALVAAFATNAHLFIGARFFEAVGMACGPVIARSMMMDVFEQQEMAKVISFSAIVVAIMPAIGPVLGGWISIFLTWHAVLLFLVLYGMMMIAITYFKIPETHLHLSASIKLGGAFKNYFHALANKQFTGSLLLYALYFGALIGFYTDAPFIFIQGLKYSETTYGWFMLIPVFAYMFGAYLAHKIIKHHSPRYSIKLGIAVSFLGVLLLYIFYLAFSEISVFTILAPISIFIIGSGIMSPSTNTLAMTIFTANKGIVAALAGCAMSLGAAVFSAIIALLHSVNFTPMLIITTLVFLLGSLIYGTTLREKT